jgi:chemotaxis protein histidine kinase CheA
MMRPPRFVVYAMQTGCSLSAELLELVQAHRLPAEIRYLDFLRHVTCVPCLHDRAANAFLSVEDTVARVKAIAKAKGEATAEARAEAKTTAGSDEEPAYTLYVHPDSPTSGKLLEYILAVDLHIHIEDVRFLDYVQIAPALEDTEKQLLYAARDAVLACAALALNHQEQQEQQEQQAQDRVQEQQAQDRVQEQQAQEHVQEQEQQAQEHVQEHEQQAQEHVPEQEQQAQEQQDHAQKQKKVQDAAPSTPISVLARVTEECDGDSCPIDCFVPVTLAPHAADDIARTKAPGKRKIEPHALKAVRDGLVPHIASAPSTPRPSDL